MRKSIEKMVRAALTLLFMVAVHVVRPAFSVELSDTAIFAEAHALLVPYEGESRAGVDPSTMTGKILCGYQGWFACEGDGGGRGFAHYVHQGEFRPGKSNVDLWPDVSEFDPEERYDTPFRLPDGKVAQVFSSTNFKTVDRHFAWMQQYGIDGIFLQRFGVELRGTKNFRHVNRVLASCRAAANLHGRTWAVMYDLSGLPTGGTQTIIDDWKELIDAAKLGRDAGDKAYLHHRGKPVVVLWGIGFNDGRKYTLAECEALVRFLKSDEKYGGNCVMLGVPTFWRTQTRDAVSDPHLHEVFRLADIISPWTIGRVRNTNDVERYAGDTLKGDLAWCQNAGSELLPVAFPGYSRGNGNAKPLNSIPRQKGEFLWSQYVLYRAAGATMLYQAMFDEMDEGTAIFKCTNRPPNGESQFLDLEGAPSDFYLRLVGAGARLLRGEPSEQPRFAAEASQ
jgi:hypothetical protein